MNKKKGIGGLFLIAAVYDGLFGAAFLFWSDALYTWFGVTPPNHPGYVQFPAALLLIFASLFFSISRDPIRNRNLIPYGILLKVAYCGVISFHWVTGDIPDMWKLFCIADLGFLVAFIWAWVALRKK